MKRFLLTAAIGGFVLMGITSWAAVPGLIWYGRPADPGALCNCATTVKWTATTFLKWQGAGFVCGAAFALFLRYVVFKKKKSLTTEQMLDL